MKKKIGFLKYGKGLARSGSLVLLTYQYLAFDIVIVFNVVMQESTSVRFAIKISMVKLKLNG